VSGQPTVAGHSVAGRPEQETGAVQPAEEAVTGSAGHWPEAAEPTGDPSVDAVLGMLSGVADKPVSAHAEFYTTVHDALLAQLQKDA
jgi:hypothetical protein